MKLFIVSQNNQTGEISSSEKIIKEGLFCSLVRF